MLERNGEIVPLRKIAHDRRRVLHAVKPLHARRALGHIDNISENHVDRNAIAVSVVNGHRGVLHSHRPVREDRQRLALHFVIAMRHGHRGFFMAAGNELRTLVPAIVDDGFVKAAKTRSRIRANVFKPQRLDHIHHEVRPGAIRGQHFRDGRNLRLGRGRHRRRNRALQLGRLRRNCLPARPPTPRPLPLHPSENSGDRQRAWFA